MPRRKSPISPMDEIHMIAKLADLKEAHYRHSLWISALTELLIEKGIVTESELQARTAHLDLLDTIEARTQLTPLYQSMPTASHNVGRS